MVLGLSHQTSRATHWKKSNAAVIPCSTDSVRWLGRPIMNGQLLHDHTATQPDDLVKWLLGAGVVHDAVIAPLVVALTWLTGRAVPVRARAPVRLGLIATAMLTVLTWPLVQGWGRRSANPSALPLDYGRNLVAVLAAIWLGAFFAITVRMRRR